MELSSSASSLPTKASLRLSEALSFNLQTHRSLQLLRPFPRNCKIPHRNLEYSSKTCKIPISLQPRCSVNSYVDVKHELEMESFNGLGDAEGPVLLCRTHTLPAALSLSDARKALISAVEKLESPHLASGIFRFQVPFAGEVKAIHWLQSQPQCRELLPVFYFSQRGQHGEGFHDENADVLKSIAGIGSAVLFTSPKPFSKQHSKSLKRFLSKDSPLIRAYGAMRFNAEVEPSEEWKLFGSFFFFIPQIECCECPSCSLLAITVAWDNSLGRSFSEAVIAAKRSLFHLSDQISATNESPVITNLYKEHVPSEKAWHVIVDDLLAALEDTESNHSYAPDQIMTERSSQDPIRVSKVVLARKTNVKVDANIEPLTLLSILQRKDPSAYQFCIKLPSGSAFIGSTPERLFYKDGNKVFSEAVAATRARGITESKDSESAIELLLSTKDHTEFDIVMDSVKQKLEVLCKEVKIKSYKRLIKQANIQHLYGRVDGQLKGGVDEFQLLSTLHPTPAVCGQPQHLAKAFLSEKEAFDRGMYGGPVGWISGNKSEFAVAIRSSLMDPQNIQPVKKQYTSMYLYAGVGIVKGAKSSAEWRELDLKIQQFEALLQPFIPIRNSVNINALWAKLIVEELCRLGVTQFCIAPGSRSSPLAVAASENYKAKCILCIDERSLAFYALGYGRGAAKPAVVITSSGTAVSNLLPAVVEANEDSVPLLLFTADRPPELHQTGANQTIDQVKHFGSFVRYQMSLPPPTAEIQSRMVLTSIDAAVFRATSNPMGPVHINIAFREPLAGIREDWNYNCLKGIERWESGSLPFTKYVKSMGSNTNTTSSSQDIKDIAKLINTASSGLLIIGGLHKMGETRACIQLAKHLGWPVIPDILSGLRLRHSAENDGNLCIIDFFDHMLLNGDLQNTIKPDVVLQVGSRITSKRLTQFLEFSQPSTYILVEQHPFRHDPCHLLTHRVQSCVEEFASVIISCCRPSPPKHLVKRLQLFSDVTESEVMFQMESESILSEPHVARLVAKSLPLDSAFFLGNSMPIRDADMYTEGRGRTPEKLVDEMQDLPIVTIRTAGNRGASGIDGVLSTAIGFAVGSGQRVTLMLGDLSFLHDTNGLMLLNNRVGQPPVVVVVVNNSGGGIFSFLPIANTTSGQTFTKFFTTPHDVSIRKLCLAHRVNHTLVRSTEELKNALNFIQKQQLDWVVEVESNVQENVNVHRHIQTATKQAIRRAFQLVQRTKDGFGNGYKNWTIEEAVYRRYRFKMSANPTTKAREIANAKNYRQGFIFSICLSNGQYGYGEVAPLEGLHKETLKDAEEQLRLLAKLLLGVEVTNILALLNGHISSWLSKNVGIPPDTLLPSVRCGLEMALLGGLSAANSCSITELLTGHKETDNLPGDNGFLIDSSKIRVCALLDSCGSPEEMASAAADLVRQGFCTLKVKVARRVSPLEDAAVMVAIRNRVGLNINLRADANQRWTFAQAADFATGVRSCGLQYIEEPVKDPADLARFCKETGLPVALDESIDRNPKHVVKLFRDLGLAAAIIKPSSVGGFENASRIAKCAQRNGMLAVISSAFESSIGLSAYAQFAAFVDQCHLESMNGNEVDQKAHILPSVAHGLGTYKWLQDDVVLHNKFSVKTTGDGIEVWTRDAATTLLNMALDNETVHLEPPSVSFCSKIYSVLTSNMEFSFQVLETQTCPEEKHDSTLVFFHGFLGNNQDWIPIMHALSGSCRCISVDLPGHGKTEVTKMFPEENMYNHDNISMKNIAEALSVLLEKLSQKKVVVVGYSMGARLALYMSLRCNNQIAAGVIISGSPGLRDSKSRSFRASEDDALALSLLETDLKSFVETWYQRPLWKSLRNHPKFANIRKSRSLQKNVDSLSRILSSLSVGRQPSLWDDLVDPPVPLLLIVGKNDAKFCQIAYEMYNCIGNPSVDFVSENDSRLLEGNGKRKFVTLIEAIGSGHAVHIENPFAIVNGISNFVYRLRDVNIVK